MLILKNTAMAETKVKNSRFVAEVHPIHSAEEAKELWRHKKETYDNGGHIVYAFTIGPQQNVCGCSDDGEPSGTAGRPVLAVLKGSGLTDTLLTIARYFGGTKLGTGGLVHAYSNAAKAVLEVAETKELIPMSHLTLTIPYTLYNTVLNRIKPFGFEVSEEQFSDDVSISGSLPEEKLPQLQATLQEIGNGKIPVCCKDSL
ncbi:MAG: YigZ family protein [Lentisphaeria bacterium]|nr:YigZ family protein [Lentisphaeria bacterium]